MSLHPVASAAPVEAPARPDPNLPALRVDELSVELNTTRGVVRIVDGVSFTLAQGETFGIVGESGSGKSITSLAIMGMIEPPLGRCSGSVQLLGRELTGLSRRELRQVRGGGIGLLFQEAHRGLDPAFSIGAQIAETVRAHSEVTRRQAWKRALELLDLVRIPNGAARAREYPHQLSGGIAQRVMLALALSCAPTVLIADEPTTALDVTVQAQVLELIRTLQSELGLAVIFISHDLGVISEMSTRIGVMYAGQMIEHASALDLFLSPRHPYTAALLGAARGVEHSGDRRLGSIPGTVPAAHDWPTGCRFHTRCEHARSKCSEEAPIASPGAHGRDRMSRCHFVGDLILRGVE